MTIVLFRSVDFETSRKDNGEPVELGWTDLWFDTETRCREIGGPKSRLFGITGEMDPGALGTHHILPEEIAGLQPWSAEAAAEVVAGVDFLVAHNASYERGFLTPELTGGEAGKWMEGAPAPPRWVCTMKCAKRAWEEAPEFGLQSLRYWRGLRLSTALALPAHRAGPDSYVGAWVLSELLQTELVNDLVRWTKEPTYYPTCPIGKHRGQRWNEIPHGFLSWMLGPDRDFEEDVRIAVRNELDERRNRGAST